MKREWTYLAALLPYTTAISSSMAFGAASDEWDSNASRHKSKASQEQEGESDGQGGKEGQGASSKSDAKTPGDASSGFDGLGGPGGGGGSGESGAHSSIASVPHVAEGMFAPLDGPAGGSAMPIILGGGGGGGGVAVTSTTRVIYIGSEGPHSEGPGSGGEPLPDNGGYVDPDPEDADAMLILVGGYAEGAGEGATSSGDVVFDIVDYGDITFGYGYATFMASGASGAAADTFFSVTGADLVFSYSTGPSHGDSAYSTTHVLAIDFEDESMFTEQQLTGFDWMQLLAEGPFQQNILGQEEDVSVDGNGSYATFEGSIQGASPSQIDFANLVYDNVGSVFGAQVTGQNVTFSLQGEAEGVETLVFADGHFLEIEDQYSSVGGSAVGVA